jgi:transposase
MALKAANANSQRYAERGARGILSEIVNTTVGFFYVPTRMRGWLRSVPGIGVVTVLAFVSTVEDPARFTKSRSVGAHLGLTPRQYQSGEVDRSGRISRCGDTLARTMMYEAAVVILSRVKKASALKDWAQAIAKRSGIGKARVALARKLCTILHSIWRSGEPFRWSTEPAGA